MKPTEAELLELLEETTDQGQIDHYETCRRYGASHKLALMFALAQAPGLVTDATYMAGHHDSGFGKNPTTAKMGDFYAAQAKKHGMTNLTGKRYLSSLARFSGDPDAWVSGRGDIKRVLERRGDGCVGTVNTKIREREPTKPIPIAEHIVERVTKQVIGTETVGPKERVKIKEQVRDTITPAHKK